MQAVGGLFSMSADAVRFVFRRPFQWREFLEQCWFIARVALAPTLLVAIPFTVLVSFTLNILLRELGAADLSGAGAAFGAVTQVGPIVTVLIVAGAGATAICADLGSRTIREEIDAMEVLGINPVQRLVTPRMLASGSGGAAAQQPRGDHRNPGRLHVLGVHPGREPRRVRRGHHAADRGARGDHLLRQGRPVRFDRRAWWPAIAGLIITGGGAKAVGNAVNETVVYAFMALFVINVVVTAIGIRMTTG